MNYKKKLLSLVILTAGLSLSGQAIEVDPAIWTAVNREATFSDGIIHLDVNPGDGILWLKDVSFRNGTILLELRGRNAPGQSFVGVAFQGTDDDTFDAIYFRPFNFRNPERKSHAVQYISMPENDWRTLREAFPGKYENEIEPPPEAEDWFSARIEIEGSTISVFVNENRQQSLQVSQIGKSRLGKFGLWVGHNSEGWFRNISLSPSE